MLLSIMELNRILKLLSDENRIRIISELKAGEICVCDLAEKINMEQSLLSHHLKKLREYDLVIERKVGRWVHYSLNILGFEELEKLFITTFSSKSIKEKKCDIHIECCPNNNCNN